MAIYEIIWMLHYDILKTIIVNRLTLKCPQVINENINKSNNWFM